MTVEQFLADDLRMGAIATGDLGGFGLRRFCRMWFNPASGHFVADAKSCFMWSESVDGPWHVVPNSVPAGRAALEADDHG